MTLDGFNAHPTDEAMRALKACCASTAWMAAMVAGRPYADRDALLARSAEALADLDWAGVRQALDAHPPIGELASRSSGSAGERLGGADREAAWSRREQSGVDAATDEVRAALAEANRAYEERFGHVFLIFATGRTDREMLAAARERVRNDDATERAVVRSELGRIVALRIQRLLDS